MHEKGVSRYHVALLRKEKVSLATVGTQADEGSSIEGVKGEGFFPFIRVKRITQAEGSVWGCSTGEYLNEDNAI